MGRWKGKWGLLQIPPEVSSGLFEEFVVQLDISSFSVCVCMCVCVRVYEHMCSGGCTYADIHVPIHVLVVHMCMNH